MTKQFHPVAELFPLMSGAEFDALKADIAENGLREAVWLHPDGSIVDGRNRYRACTELGIEPEYRTWNGQGSLESLVDSLNLHRRHLTKEQRDERMRTLRAKGLTYQQIADVVGVSHMTVKRFVDSDLTFVKSEIENARGQTRPASYEKRTPVPEWDDEEDTPTKVYVEVFGEWGDTIQAEGYTLEPDEEIGIVKKPHVSHNSGNNEWYTPAEYIEAARAVMGAIDLDPASSEIANSLVGATQFYDIASDGLRQTWRGKIWLNPPYASDLVGKFIDKLLASSQVTEAIVLVNNATETQWFQALAKDAGAVCFPSTRIRFWNPDKEKSAPLQGQAILYIGVNSKKFMQEFSEIGTVWQK